MTTDATPTTFGDLTELADVISADQLRQARAFLLDAANGLLRRPSLFELGALHRAARELVETIEEPLLHELMRAARARGATLQEILEQTGYTSLMTVRKVVSGGLAEVVRDREAALRRQRIAAVPGKTPGATS